MIRKLCNQDLEVFKSLRLEALRTEPDSFASSAEDWEQFPDGVWLRKLTESDIFAVVEVGNPIGMAALTRQQGSKISHRATVGMVYVRRQMRGAGHAAALMRAVTSHAKDIGVRQLELTVSSANPSAIRFYIKEGFLQIGRIPNGFIHEERAIDDVMMVRQVV